MCVAWQYNPPPPACALKGSGKPPSPGSLPKRLLSIPTPNRLPNPQELPPTACPFLPNRIRNHPTTAPPRAPPL